MTKAVHLEICPYCHRKALEVNEIEEPYPRVVAECRCCGYRSYDKPMAISEDKFREILDKLGRKQIGEICIDDKCGSEEVIKLLREGKYTEYRCLSCGFEWNSEEMEEVINRVKEVRKEIKAGKSFEDVLMHGEGVCPLCGWDIGHRYEGYLVAIECPICGYHNEFKEEKPSVDPDSIECPEYERPEEAG